MNLKFTDIYDSNANELKDIIDKKEFTSKIQSVEHAIELLKFSSNFSCETALNLIKQLQKKFKNEQIASILCNININFKNFEDLFNYLYKTAEILQIKFLESIVNCLLVDSDTKKLAEHIFEKLVGVENLNSDDATKTSNQPEKQPTNSDDATKTSNQPEQQPTNSDNSIRARNKNHIIKQYNAEEIRKIFMANKNNYTISPDNKASKFINIIKNNQIAAGEFFYKYLNQDEIKKEVESYKTIEHFDIDYYIKSYLSTINDDTQSTSSYVARSSNRLNDTQSTSSYVARSSNRLNDTQSTSSYGARSSNRYGDTQSTSSYVARSSNRLNDTQSTSSYVARSSNRLNDTQSTSSYGARSSNRYGDTQSTSSYVARSSNRLNDTQSTSSYVARSSNRLNDTQSTSSYVARSSNRLNDTQSTSSYGARSSNRLNDTQSTSSYVARSSNRLNDTQSTSSCDNDHRRSQSKPPYNVQTMITGGSQAGDKRKDRKLLNDVKEPSSVTPSASNKFENEMSNFQRNAKRK
ncbi:hypothetical protein TVAG_150060 [Trichomonas vaginalis G3]|uniref:Uncharacterized protein n=1 Tax=Trichomonas vaginalis (strain ATCC PRA-98 / G3) TaxID=412133 RepID=A2DRQ8_TRIV3|nr:hypothetical protein TVAGG3_0979160 [Trichomonas vaginalis G3]EAY16855.1 hypothetical protein TVAG_150060 [Trichomonas vaginalis G3]KAI5489156.1 hypothetical protein TVAGG3_0979160 [Trichomonas vaginalis G3]|eukprot:XP_001329078.1 hypothetical protein [Trichomonas vaginalis G3]